MCVWIPTVWSSFPSAGDDVSLGSACSSDPPALPTYPWPLPLQPNGTCIYRERAGKCSISLEMQMQTYLVQTVDSGWVQIRPVLLPKRERETISINLKVCLKMGRHPSGGWRERFSRSAGSLCCKRPPTCFRPLSQIMWIVIEICYYIAWQIGCNLRSV